MQSLAEHQKWWYRKWVKTHQKTQINGVWRPCPFHYQSPCPHIPRTNNKWILPPWSLARCLENRDADSYTKKLRSWVLWRTAKFVMHKSVLQTDGGFPLEAPPWRSENQKKPVWGVKGSGTNHFLINTYHQIRNDCLGRQPQCSEPNLRGL